MRAMILGLCAMVLLSGCAERHKFIQQDKHKYLVYVQPPLDVLRPNPVPEPTYCTKLVDVEYDPPLQPNFWQKLFGMKPDRTFKGCGEREWEQKEGIWLANVKYDSSVVEKVGPLLSGAAFMAGSMGAAAILGGHIESGLKGQATGGTLQGASVSTINVCGTGPAFVGMKPAPGCR